MQKIIFLALILIKFTLHAQQVVTFKEAPEKNIRIVQLDSLYAPALGDSLAVFVGQEEQLTQAYSQFVRGFGEMLVDSNFVWPSAGAGEIRGFNRIYFHADGSVAYWVYSLKKMELSATAQLRFEQLLLTYCKQHSFSLTASRNFVQCAPVVWRP